MKIPGLEDSHTEDVESGSETSDTVSNSGQSGGQNLAPNVTLITLNSEGRQNKLSKSIAQSILIILEFTYKFTI